MMKVIAILYENNERWSTLIQCCVFHKVSAYNHKRVCLSENKSAKSKEDMLYNKVKVQKLKIH